MSVFLDRVLNISNKWDVRHAGANKKNNEQSKPMGFWKGLTQIISQDNNNYYYIPNCV